MRAFQSQHIPLPRSELVAPAACFDLEIGPGAGLHPILYNKQYPERVLVAIERTQEKFEKFEGRWRSHGKPKNLYPVHDDAISWVTHRVAEHALQRVFILYPNPEMANKNQRFAHMPFMDFLKTRLAPNGIINIATNIEVYAQECLQILPSRGFELVSKQTPALPGRTHFERKYLARGETCYDLVFKKAEQ